MTEEEASKKWCPFVRVALVEGMAANRTRGARGKYFGDIHDETRCIASECMMWRPMNDGYPGRRGCCGLTRR